MVSIDACIELLKQEFEKDEMIAQVQEFLKRASYSPKWMLYSDYCLSDRGDGYLFHRKTKSVIINS